MSKLILKHPIALGKGQLTELHLRDHTTAEDYLAFDVYGGVAQTQRLISNIAGLDDAIVRKLHGEDYRRARAHVEAMLEADDPDKAPAESANANDGAAGAAAASEAAKKP